MTRHLIQNGTLLIKVVNVVMVTNPLNGVSYRTNRFSCLLSCPSGTCFKIHKRKNKRVYSLLLLPRQPFSFNKNILPW